MKKNNNEEIMHTYVVIGFMYSHIRVSLYIEVEFHLI